MRKFIRHSSFIIYFFIFYFLAFNGGIVRIDDKNLVVNFVQMIMLLPIFIRSYTVFEICVKRKRRLVIQKIVKTVPVRGYFGKLFKMQRYFFVGLLQDEKELILSKLIRNKEPAPGKQLYYYHDMSNKIKVVDRYAIAYAFLQLVQLTLLYVLIVSLVKYIVLKAS